MTDFRQRFIVSLILTVTILILSPGFQAFFGVEYSFPGSALILLTLSTAVYAYGGYPFLKGIVQEIRARLPGMMTLIAVAITVAYIFSAIVVLGVASGALFFWELATHIDIMLLGHWVEMRSGMGASRALEELVNERRLRGHATCRRSSLIRPGRSQWGIRRDRRIRPGHGE